MQEVKLPKNPLIYFYVVMILAILVFNCLIIPHFAWKAIEDVDYGHLLFIIRRSKGGFGYYY